MRVMAANPVANNSAVIPAKAGIHNHRPLEYGSPPSRGRQSLWIVGLSLIACAMLSASPVAAADKVRVGKAVAEAFSFVPPDVGVSAGIFQKNNIDPELIAFAGDARMQQAAAADSIDLLLG